MRKRMIKTTLLLMATVVVSAQGLKTTVDEGRKAEIRETLALDYPMPDYSTSKIDAKVMGARLAAILKKNQEMKAADKSMGSLSVIQANQIDGMIYCAVKKVMLDKVVKQGNEMTIVFDTTLKENAKNLKKAQFVSAFVDGVSDDIATNDFFTSVYQYIKDN